MKEDNRLLSRFTWAISDSPAQTGRKNMEEDEILFASVKPGEAFLRLYTWIPYCISLGYNQSEAILDHEQLAKDGIEYIHRPTGGKAVLHAEELTYAVVLGLTERIQPGLIYEEINHVLASGLAGYDDRLQECGLEEIQPDLRTHALLPEGDACFSVPAKSELKFRGKKICGSAQRYGRYAVLQHGSLLTGGFHLRLPQYLNTSDEVKTKIYSSLTASASDLGTILGEEIDMKRLRKAIIQSFMNATEPAVTRLQEITES